jgi:hypothetical protein
VALTFLSQDNSAFTAPHCNDTLLTEATQQGGADLEVFSDALSLDDHSLALSVDDCDPRDVVLLLDSSDAEANSEEDSLPRSVARGRSRSVSGSRKKSKTTATKSNARPSKNVGRKTKSRRHTGDNRKKRR